MNQLMIKSLVLVFYLNVFSQILQAQCILGDIEVCANNQLIYNSGYVDDPSNPVISWTWSVSDPLKAKVIRTNIDTIELEFIQSGQIDLQLQMLTEMGTLINCDLSISVLENQDFDISMTTISGCIPDTEDGVICKGYYSTFTTNEHVAYLHHWYYKNQSIGSGGESDPILFEQQGMTLLHL